MPRAAQAWKLKEEYDMSQLVSHYLELLERRSGGTAGAARRRLDSNLATLAAVMTPEEVRSSWGLSQNHRIHDTRGCAQDLGQGGTVCLG